MFEQHTFYENNPFVDDLAADEQLLWLDQPDAGKWFTQGDLLFVPFSLLWGGFALFWNAMVWLSNAPIFFRLWGLPFLLIGFTSFLGDSCTKVGANVALIMR
jgi:hypothetical protein